MKISEILADVARAQEIGPAFSSVLEGFSALLADCDELWSDVKANNDVLAFAQAERVAGTAIRFVSEIFRIPPRIVARDMLVELRVARTRFGNFNSGHEGYAVILEELDELWDEIRLDHHKSTPATRKRIGEEAIQLGAMGLRFVEDVYGADVGKESEL